MSSQAPRTRNRWWVYTAAVVAVIVVVLLVAWALTGGFHSGSHGMSSTILIPSGTGYTLPGGQLDAVNVIVPSTSVINGTIIDSYGIIIYQMTPDQLSVLVKTLIVPGYEWTSGVLGNATVYNIDITVSPGAWVIVFLNPHPFYATGVGFYTALTLTPT